MTSEVFVASPSSKRAVLNRLFWRVHFWAGLVTAPIVLFAALTGLLYIFSPQVEAWRYADLDRVPVGRAMQPLDAQVAAAQAARPGSGLRFVVPAHSPGETTQVVLRDPHAGHANSHDHGLPNGTIVYVDPYSGAVVGQLPELQRLQTWVKKLHSSALQGDGLRWPIELAASWMLVMFATGLTMWWPRSQAQGGPGWRALIPQRGRGRQTWRDLHVVVALAMGLVLSVIVITGLTWSRHAGNNFRLAQQALGQESPKPSASLTSTLIPGVAPMSWQAVWDEARRAAPDISLQLTPPKATDGTWRVENFDRGQPTKRVVRVLDAYSGRTLFASDWSNMPLLARATAIGIPFHRGEFGLWNQALLALAALAAIFSVVSGIVMWWQRRPRGQLAAPTLNRQHVQQVPMWLWVLALALAFAMPVFGWSLLLFAALEAVRLVVPASRLNQPA
jgi:uncharacterized iron-regulated membrane protein